MLLKQKYAARLALLFGATTWGVIWLPFRALQDAGVSGELSTFLTYAVALCLGLMCFRKAIPGIATHWKMLLWIALAAGWTNLGFVLAVIHGTLVRVTLLFYLAPLWTVILSWVLLKEKLTLTGLWVIVLSLAGALTMLWQPGDELPMPQSSAEWLALTAGLAFALSNVLVRKAQQLAIPQKSLAVWVGVTLAALALSLVNLDTFSVLTTLSATIWISLFLLGALILVMTAVVQFGLSNTPSNQAIVIFLFELVVVAVSSHLLAAERVTWQEWAGGVMIVSAILFSSKMQPQDPGKDNRVHREIGTT